MTTVFTTFVLWITFTFLVCLWSNYFDACTWLLAMDVGTNMICTFLMFKFSTKYYEKCMRCKPFGSICLSLVHWIELYKLRKPTQKMTANTIINHNVKAKSAKLTTNKQGS